MFHDFGPILIVNLKAGRNTRCWRHKEVRPDRLGNLSEMEADLFLELVRGQVHDPWFLLCDPLVLCEAGAIYSERSSVRTLPADLSPSQPNDLREAGWHYAL